MMVNSKSSKCPKTSKDFSNGIDRISKLPDHLISHILSLLPTKTAVATSVLSTRWKFLWTSVTKVYFEFECCSEERVRDTVEMRKRLEMKREFTLFVNRVLLLVNAPIHEFCLNLCRYDCVDPSDLFSWISFGFEHTVRKFDLFSMYDGAMDLPLNRIFCNVAVIKLDGDIHIDIPASASLCFPSVQSLTLQDVTPLVANNSSISFPNLKNMNLRHVRFADDDSIQKFLSSSPVLDDLIIERSSLDGIEYLVICIPSLTRLTIELQFEESELDDRVHKIKIDSPALQYLKVVDCMPCEYVPGESFSFLLKADLEIYSDGDYNFNVENHISLIKFLGRLSKVNFLSTTSVVLKAFSLANITLGFQNLKCLKIIWFDCQDLCIVIDSFPEGMDNLEHLILEVEQIGRMRSRYTCYHQSCWSEPLNVPNCLLSRVTTVSISYMIVDCCDQLNLLKYILKNAEVLQLLTIDATHVCEKEQLEFVKKISLMPKGSQTCQVAFTLKDLS